MSKFRFSAAHNRAKATIKACAETGAGIEYLPDAPNFRFTPAADKPLHCGPPSPRGSIACGSNPLKLKNWHPARLDLNPMYLTPLTDTDEAERRAKAAWTNGDPKLLRELLAKRALARADAKIAEVCLELFDQAA